MNARRFSIRTAPPDRLDYRNWLPLDTSGYNQAAQLRVSALTSALRTYIDGDLVGATLRDAGIYRETVLRAFNRCIALDCDGRPFGWRALRPGLHVVPYTRRKALVVSEARKRGGLAGALTLFLQRHADLAEEFDAYLLASAKRRAGAEAGVYHKSAHRKFIQLCRDAGLADFEWPLCTHRLAAESIRGYVQRFLEARYDSIVGTQFGQRAQARSRTGTGYATRLTAFSPFDVVELDEHRCQFMGSIGVESPEGLRWLPLERINIIVAVDRRLNLILGYKVIFRREANADDLLDVLQSAIGAGTPRCYIEGQENETTAGLPSELGEPFLRCGFNQLLFDSALIHLAQEVAGRARMMLGCDHNYGPVRHFERRPTVENVFGQLERLGFRRLPTTTGSSPQDPVRQHPARAAQAAKVPVTQILALIAGVVRDHNAASSKSNFGAAPLARLEAARDDLDGTGVIFPVLPPTAPGVPGLDVSVVRVTVRGSKESGRRPYFTYLGEAYTGTTLAHDWALLRGHLNAHVRRDDIREIQVFKPSGEFVDKAVVTGRWRHSRHSCDMRKHINARIRAGYLPVTYTQDPVRCFLDAVAAAAGSQPGRKATVAQKDLGRVAEHQVCTEPRPVAPGGLADAREELDKRVPTATESSCTGGSASGTDDEELLEYADLVAFDGRDS